MTEKKVLEVEVEKQESEIEEKQFSSLDLIWKLGFDELDAWAARYNKRDEIFLEAAKSYVDRIKQNQESILTIAGQFTMELKDWEQAAREELLATTTTLQHFFPIKSYEEFNQVVEDIQNKTASLLVTPLSKVTIGQIEALEKYLAAVDQYISLRKKGRENYVNSVKKTTNVLYENQKLFLNLFSKQVKTAMLPFQKYMKSVTEVTKS
ncbi:hypothetical protein [Neobacillus vireti]|uniref:Uncharacterized protein n=1 Tax=Neobacillus vireti LMG 21834 TaxID=1131730 RepID=A0AB94IQZ4_9BACI|nr:hypothetical protein [Neobacillus vireti]ETI69479.1 hypothetical protein BAVI_07304 [Neobacillus vireti LMG 21834]KLT19296.1 hypothetical protein AA980_01440 [Neobacillus vireti]